MNNKEIEVFDLLDCPYCGGPGVLDHVGNRCCYVECMDCGARTSYIFYRDEKSKKEAEQTSVTLWNNSKVVNFGRGE